MVGRIALVSLSCALMAGPPSLARPVGAADPLVCAITDFGAVADDEALDDAAISAAINLCAGRGGRVLVPAGVFLSGGIALRSRMELYLAPGAVLRGAARLADYRVWPTGDRDRTLGLIAGIGVHDVVISGSGVLDGAGTPFHATPNARPHFTLGLFDCADVSVTGIRIVDPAKYHVTTNRCSGVHYDQVTILADMLAPNSDGIQVRDSSDVRISRCRIETGDDAIVLKSSQRWVERVFVSDCHLRSDDAAFKFGTGSEPGIRHVSVSDVTITGSRYGIALFMQDGGVYEHARFSNILIETGGRHAREYPIFVDIDTRQPDDPAGWGQIRHLTFDGIDILTRGTILIQGQPGHDIVDLRLVDIVMRVASAVDPRVVHGKPRGNRAHAPRTGAADHSNQFAHAVIAHATGVVLSGLDARGLGEADRRPPLRLIDVRDVQGGPNGSEGEPQ